MSDILPRWPKTSDLGCGCRVALKREGEGDIVLYFPCSDECPTLDQTKTEAKRVGIKWESRNVSNN